MRQRGAWEALEEGKLHHFTLSFPTPAPLMHLLTLSNVCVLFYYSEAGLHCVDQAVLQLPASPPRCRN